MDKRRFNVRFMPREVNIKVPAGSPLSLAALEAGIEFDSSCGGRGKCGKCRARVKEGRLSGPTAAEKNLIPPRDLGLGYILLCQRTVLDDCVIESESPDGEGGHSLLQKGVLMDLPTHTDSPISKIYLELTLPTLKDAGADLERICSKLRSKVKVDPVLLPRIPGILRQSRFKPTLVLMNGELIGIESGDTSQEAYGIAFDIGTTTVAGYLVDVVRGKVLGTASAANRQERHGADVISRISHANVKSDGVREMQSLVAETLRSIISELLKKSQVDAERVYALVFTGNTVMMHFLLGTTPENIALAPFVPAFTSSIGGKAAHVGLQDIMSHSRFITLPNIAGYVGSDTVSVMVATRIHERPGNWLAIDIGTNGEVVLSSQGRLLTCSTAAGPAFEGGCISQGMRAIKGAVYKVDFQRDPIYSAIDNGEPRGLCGSGLLDAVSEMVRVGILHRSGRILSPDECPAHLPRSLRDRIEQTDSGPRFVLASGKRQVAVTQKDIREVQLAKGAIRAGIEILLKEAGISASDLNGVMLAGAFGSNLQPESIEGIGMLPELPVDRITPVGNAAGTGAVMVLLSKENLDLASALAARTEHVELSVRSDFQKIFLTAMEFERGFQ
jgi:uncharacterized 2Fe-2S/4Fe-4S cluster protein (DUF4445 family)